jgi:hypothetical protein
MVAKIRRRLSYANVAVTLALVFAMAGGAFAAKKFIITSTKQISPRVIKALGAARAGGTAGSAGAGGNEGLQGERRKGRPGRRRSERRGRSVGPMGANEKWARVGQSGGLIWVGSTLLIGPPDQLAFDA